MQKTAIRDRAKAMNACCDAVDRLRDALDYAEGDRALEREIVHAITVVAGLIEDCKGSRRDYGH